MYNDPKTTDFQAPKENHVRPFLGWGKTMHIDMKYSMASPRLVWHVSQTISSRTSSSRLTRKLNLIPPPHFPLQRPHDDFSLWENQAIIVSVCTVSLFIARPSLGNLICRVHERASMYSEVKVTLLKCVKVGQIGCSMRGAVLLYWNIYILGKHTATAPGLGQWFTCIGETVPMKHLLTT